MTTRFPIARRRWPRLAAGRALLVGALLSLISILSGCGDSEPQLESLIEVVPVKEELHEVDAGQFIISIPAPPDASQGHAWAPNVQLVFHLFALVGADEKEEVTALLEERRGRMNDEVIRLCRSLDVDDLRDPRNHFLGVALKEAGDIVLGRGSIQRFVVADFSLEVR